MSLKTPATPLPRGTVVCPTCGENARRIHRSLRDRLVSLVKPGKRYRCHFCEWTGLLQSPQKTPSH